MKSTWGFLISRSGIVLIPLLCYRASLCCSPTGVNDSLWGVFFSVPSMTSHFSCSLSVSRAKAVFLLLLFPFQTPGCTVPWVLFCWFLHLPPHECPSSIIKMSLASQFLFSMNFPSNSLFLSLKIPLESQCICDKVYTSYLWLFFILDF